MLIPLGINKGRLAALCVWSCVVSVQSKTNGRGPGRPVLPDEDRRSFLLEVGYSPREKRRLIILAGPTRLATFVRETSLRRPITVLAPDALQAARDLAQIEQRLGAIIILTSQGEPAAIELAELHQFVGEAGRRATAMARRSRSE